MDNNSIGAQIPKKSRSLDLKSLYEAEDSRQPQNNSLKRKDSGVSGDDDKRNKRKKRRKAVPVSSFKDIDDRSRKSSNQVCDGGVSADSHDSEGSKKARLSQKLKNSSGFNGISLNLDHSAGGIPRRKRGFVGRNKFEGSQLNSPGQSSNVLVNQTAKLTSDDSGTQDDESSKVRRKNKGKADHKENIHSEQCSAQCVKEEEGLAGHSVVNNGSSLKRSRRNPRKRKALGEDCKNVVPEPLADSKINTYDRLQEDDEENLEENAARMLSSRFDPSFAGFSSKGNASASPSVNGLSYLLSSDRNCAGPGSESASADMAGRVLRPRKHHKEKGGSRKRRHFYEIFSENLDAYWVLNRRIKVFWPLDQSWYYGLVNDYDEEKKLHHVKYDDRDEEWINLQNERFKLLLFPSEAPSKSERRRSRRRHKQSDEDKSRLKLSKEERRNSTTEDDSFEGSYMDSEPIISWLARSTHRVKSSSLGALKRQKTSAAVSPTSMRPQSCGEAVDVHGYFDEGSLEGDKIKLSSDATLSDRLAVGRWGRQSSFENPRCPKGGKLPIVYFRRRFRGTGKASSLRSQGDHFGASMHGSVPSLDPFLYEFNDFEEQGIYLERSDPKRDLWCTNDAGQLELNTSLLDTKQFRFELRFPVFSVPKNSLGVEKFGLSHSWSPPQTGVVMTTWPLVRLEILFVDNIAGLRFLVFEGCLKQAVAFVFQVLAVFYESTKQGKFADLQLPVTSIRFKFSCSQNLVKQLVFAFYSFHEVKNSKWTFLDSKFKKHCLLSRQLPLSDCTYDNIKALQNGTNCLPCSPARRDFSSVEGLRKKVSRQGISLMGVSRESSLLKVGHLSSKSDRQRNLPPFALSFAAAPTFFLSLHLKLLMEHSLAYIGMRDHDSIEQPGSLGRSIVDDNSVVENLLQNVSESGLERSLKGSSRSATSDGRLNSVKSDLQTVDLSICNGQCKKSSSKSQNGDLNIDGTSVNSSELGEVGENTAVPLQNCYCSHLESEQCVSSLKLPVDGDKTKTGSNPVYNGIRVEIPVFNQYEKHADRELHSTLPSNDLTCSMNGGVIPSPNPTAPRSTWHRNRSSLVSGYLAHGWSDGKADLFHNNFGSGSRKPRTQVSYSLPFGGLDYSTKNKVHPQKGLPHKRIRKANEKRLSDVSRGSQRNMDLLSCDANVLITLGDKGWRESGAQIVLELFEHNEWKLAVKISGTTKYTYKAHQFLQPGSTNRYTHAMMWKGGKDWILEFPDRSQWALFKEMHEECYNRNIRAASVKNIPIPGVCLIEEYDDNGTEAAFGRSTSKYFRQVENDIEMALNRARILYDMDSDDEQWVLRIRNTSEAGDGCLLEISEEMFEKTMDMFEKVAYVQQRDNFTSEEIEELTAGVGPIETVKAIYEHWRQKRQRVGMPLIRHLQPPLWERYQQQLRDWELAMLKVNSMFPNGCSEKVSSIEKPPMLAFCLKPRGLEVLNKGSKHRSQRRISVSGKINATLGDHDGSHSFGRRPNGIAFGDEKYVYPAYNYESFDDSPLSQASPRVFSRRDTGSTGYFSVGYDGFDRNHHQKLQRSKSKKDGPSNEMQMLASYNQRLMGRRNGINRWNLGFSDWPSQRHFYSDDYLKHDLEQLDGSDLDEYRLRGASAAARHALNMAKLKREKAHRLMFRADVAIHKAVVALMTADAVKASYVGSNDNPNGDE
ncbi:hypothetical protein SLE2022_152220 [Rubroshorea leprosula]